MTDVIQRKLARLANDPTAKPRVLDLFAGCGGLSLGFDAAGFEITAAVEFDPLAAQSHAINFAGDHTPEQIALHGRARDITKIEPAELADEFGLGDVAEAFDVIVGGPPCQAYARVGRAKLREVAEHPEAFKVDPRANLYLRYLRYVQETQPLALLMENVPDILNHGGVNIVQEMVETLDVMGYAARYSLINSAHHGVPQMRDRVFMIAFRKELNVDIRFPKASRWCSLPSGYQGTRAVALKFVSRHGAGAYVEPDIGTEDLPNAVTAREAIGDLPAITLHREGKLKKGARRFTELSRYRDVPDGELPAYAKLMRGWRKPQSSEGVFDHVLRSLPRDTTIFEAMEEGDEYPAAYRVALRLFEKEARRRGFTPSNIGWSDLKDAMVPPYDPSKFPNRWWKLRRDSPVRTLMAHIGKDTYSHIHYDSAQGRVITVREAARLQSFPDGFVFAGTMNPAFKQIGNAVPPLMAKALAVEMRAMLREVLTEGGVAIAAE